MDKLKKNSLNEWELYLHIPFCKQRCAYCDFYSMESSSETLRKAYRQTLTSHIQRVYEILDCKSLASLYVGGGTPTLLQDELPILVGDVLTNRSREYESSSVSEISVEANPESVSTQLLDELKNVGVTRISLGVQSLVDEELASVDRLHDASAARRAVETAISKGFDVSADIICGLPAQTQESLISSLSWLTEQGISHISLYPLQLEKDTRLEQRILNGTCILPSEDEVAQFMKIAHAFLEEKHYVHYEIANYALPNKMCQHNLGYWLGRSYIGLGSTAASCIEKDLGRALAEVFPQLPAWPHKAKRLRFTILNSAQSYAATPKLQNLKIAGEYLDEPQSIAESLMLKLRLFEGITQSDQAQAQSILGKRNVQRCFALLVSHGLLQEHEGCIALSKEGWLFANEVFAEVWYLAPEHKTIEFSC